MGCQTEIPDIVKTLREEEKKGFLNNYISSVTSELEQLNDSPDENSEKTIIFKDEGETDIDKMFISEKENQEVLNSSAVNKNNDLLVYIDSEGKIITANQEFLKIIGLKDKDIRDKNIWDIPILHEKIDIKDFKKQFNTSKNGQNSSELAIEFNTDDEKRIFNLSFCPFETNGKIQQLILIGKDNTFYYDLQKKLEDSENRFVSLSEYFENFSNNTISLGKKDLFSDVSDIIFQISPSGRISYINSAVEKMAGYSFDEIIGSEFSILIPKNDWKKIKKDLFSRKNKTNLMDREINDFETVIIRRDGSVCPVEINGKLFSPNFEVVGRKAPIRIQGSIRDISERKKAEKELKEMNDELQAVNEELKSMNNELNETNDDLSEAQTDLKILNEELEIKVLERTAKIEKLLKHKDEFIEQLGHDLKSPLTPLVGLLPTIQEKVTEPDIKELLSVISRNVYYMRELVTKTLKLERLNSPNVHPNLEKINLYEIINKIINNKQLVLNDKKIHFENKIKKNLKFDADRLHITELFDNLITNSMKFTLDNGKITLDAKKRKNLLTILVQDTGIGMTDVQIEKIFDEFYKADPSRHDLESSGLGLPICKRIVEKHNGRIWAESSGLDKGSTFYVEIPLSLKDKDLITKKDGLNEEKNIGS